MQDLEELKIEREHLLRTCDDIVKAAEKANRELNDEDHKTIAAHMQDADNILKQIDALKKHNEVSASVRSALEANRKPEPARAPRMEPNDGQPQNAQPAIEFPRYGKLKAFKSERDAYKCGQWARAALFNDPRAKTWCRENNVRVETRAQSEGLNSTGGALVPSEFMNTIIDLRDTYGVFRREAKMVPMGRDIITVPRRTGGLTAYWGSENTAITESNATWNNVQLTAKKLGCYSLISSELAEDAVVNIADWLAQEAAYAFAGMEDDTGFNGDGTSTYHGIQGVTTKIEANASNIGYVLAATSGHDTFAEIDSTDISTLMSKLPTYARPNAKFYCSQVCHDLVFQRLALSAGGNTIQTMQGAYGPSFLGYPVVITPYMPTATTDISGQSMILFGDLSMAAMIGERREFTFAQSSDYKFAEDQIAVKATERIDINVHDIGDTSNAGPVVALIGN